MWGVFTWMNIFNPFIFTFHFSNSFWMGKRMNISLWRRCNPLWPKKVCYKPCTHTTLFQRLYNVRNIVWTLKQRCVLTGSMCCISIESFKLIIFGLSLWNYIYVLFRTFIVRTWCFYSVINWFFNHFFLNLIHNCIYWVDFGY